MFTENNDISLEDVRRAMNLTEFDPVMAQEHMAPTPRGQLPENKNTPPREAGVLLLMYEADGELQIVLTKRTDSLRGHSGQISFPGGKRDPEDASFKATALRETCEELGICEDIDIIGHLSPFYIPPSHFNVYPFVGFLDAIPVFRPNPAEVDSVIICPVNVLLSSDFKQHEYRTFNGYKIKVPYYLVDEHKVWGATAAMLSEFEQRLHSVL